MISEILLSIFGFSILSSSFIYFSLWGVKILYVEKLKDLKKYKGETIDLIRERQLLLNHTDEEYIKLNNLLIDLIKVK